MTELASSLAANAIEKLGSRVYREISLARGVESDLKNLRETMTTIQAYLLDAEDRQGKNPGLSVWLAQLKDVFYDAMNVLDSFESEVLRRQVMKTPESNIRKVRRFISSSNPLVFDNKMGHRIKKIRERLRVKADDRDLLKLGVRRDDRPNAPREGETNSLLPYKVIGRDGDKQKIMDLLIDSSDVDNVSVISICGLGGIGKTTLAKYLYHDERVVKHFPLKFWVHISKDLNIPTLAKEILNSIGVEGIASKTDNNLQADVQKALNGIRIFMVLDNVREVALDKWYEVKHLLDAAAEGSKIVVTTPYQYVASLISSNPNLIFFIESLSDNDCFSLFLRRVFNEGEEKQYPTLVDIGRRIMEKCKGVPLAVTVLGDFLRSEYKDDRDWAHIGESEIYKLDQYLKQGGFFLPTLKLSYDQLSSNLKPVFAYLSLYPKDYNFSSIELIQSLMANGLLGHRSETMEENGKQYLQELFARSFCKEVKKKDNGFYFTFKIHDLMHELSRFVAKDDHCLIGKNDSSKIYEGARHVSIFYDSLGASEEAASVLHKLSNGVRTIIFRNKDGDLININESFLKTCILRFKYMRLLDLSLLSFKVLPSSIRILKLLRYLSLQGNTQIKKLPNSICDLQSLETLLLAGCKELEELPRDIRKMMSLRYLSITTKQTCLPENGIECLPSLRTLIFSDCPKLESLPNNVKHFTALRSLDFRSCDSLMSLPQVALERLTIVDCGKLDLMEGEDYPTSLRSLVTGALPQLQDLPKLVKESATTLQFLHMYDCGNLTKLPDWVTQLTSLQKLQFWSCPKLSSLPEGMTCLTALRELEIRECPELRRYCDQEVAKDWPVIKYIDGLND